MPTIDKAELLTLTTPYGQQHLLAFWDQLTAAQQESLAAQIRGIDFALFQQLYAEAEQHEDLRAVAARAGSPPAVRLDAAKNRFSSAQARPRGQEALAAGRVGAILVAGGQGTRLGFAHPKGMYPIGPVSGRSLFQIHVEKIVAASRRYGVRIPLYLMTSHATHDATAAFFAAHDHFGLPEDDLRLFCQAAIPAVDAASGKILLDRPDHVFAGPDGHGGMLAALARSGCLDDMRRRGIEQLFYFQVDNPLVDICGPEFIGHHLLAGSELSTQVIAKRQPLEKVGNVVEVDGRLRIIEYSDLPDDAAHKRLADGSLAIWAGSIGVHVMAVDFLRRMAESAGGLPWHRARKKVPFVDATGQRIEPSQPNAIKYERFIFDLLPSAANALVVEVDAVRAFAPLKNASGEKCDTPETVQSQMTALAAEWLRRAGAEVAAGAAMEISPLVALDADELAAKIQPGMKIRGATYLR